MKTYDLLTEVEKIKSIQTQNGKIISVKNSNFEKKGLRKFDNSQCYYFSYFGEISTEEFVHQSKALPGTGIPLSFQLPELQSRSYSCESTHQLSPDQLEAKLGSIEEALAPWRERFSLSGTYRLNHRKTTFSDSTGQALAATKVESNHWYRIKRNGSASIMDGFFWNCTLNLTPNYTAECLAKTLEGYDRKASLTPGKYPVLFAQQGDAEGGFLEKIKSSLMADKYFEKAGLLSGQMGNRIFNEQLTLVDSSVNPRLGVFAPFDGEGFVREHKNLTLIENGVVKNVIADQKLAHQYKVKPTGNGLRDFKSAPSVGYNSVEILPGAHSTESLLKSLPKCVVVMMCGGGDFTDVGDYSQAVEFSYLLEFGEVVGRLPALTVRSTVQKMFGPDLIEIASDNYFKSGASPSVFMTMDVFVN